MRELVLLRHAHAEAGAGSDFERPLSPLGEADAIRVGSELAITYGGFDVVLTSPARRTRSTAERVAHAVSYDAARIRFESSAYEASAGTLLSLLQGLPSECRRALLVAHNPGISRLGAVLLQSGGGELAPAQYLRLDVQVEEWIDLAPGRVRQRVGR